MTDAAHSRPLAPLAGPSRRDAMDEQKRAFLRTVSHELRTPLNSILGFSEILTSELYGPLGAPQYKEYAEVIRGSGKKLLKLVNQVLEIARLEAGLLDLDAKPESLDAALDDVLAGLREDLADRDLTITVAGRDALPSVLADPQALRTVLFHLLQNAVAFSHDGGEVRVCARHHPGEVEVIIEDEGVGVEPTELPRLMEPFEQGGNVAARRGEGAGLGLAICELTCRAMDGRLRLASKPGRGLTARVRLPAA